MKLLSEGLFQLCVSAISVSGESSPRPRVSIPITAPRLRRELSGKGKDAFLRGDHEASLQFYNEALLYSTGKGIAHTLAMVC